MAAPRRVLKQLKWIFRLQTESHRILQSIDDQLTTENGMELVQQSAALEILCRSTSSRYLALLFWSIYSRCWPSKMTYVLLWQNQSRFQSAPPARSSWLTTTWMFFPAERNVTCQILPNDKLIQCFLSKHACHCRTGSSFTYQTAWPMMSCSKIAILVGVNTGVNHRISTIFKGDWTRHKVGHWPTKTRAAGRSTVNRCVVSCCPENGSTILHRRLSDFASGGWDFPLETSRLFRSFRMRTLERLNTC